MVSLGVGIMFSSSFIFKLYLLLLFLILSLCPTLPALPNTALVTDWSPEFQTYFQLSMNTSTWIFHGYLEQNETYSLSSKKPESPPIFPFLLK